MTTNFGRLADSLFEPFSMRLILAAQQAQDEITAGPEIVLMLDMHFEEVRALLLIPLSPNEGIAVSPKLNPSGLPRGFEIEESAAVYHARQLLKEHKLAWHPETGFWSGRPNLAEVETLIQRISAPVDLFLSDSIAPLAAGVQTASVKLSVKKVGEDWYDVSGNIQSNNGTVLNAADLQMLRLARGRPVSLGAKGCFEMDISAETARIEGMGLQFDSLLAGNSERLHTLHMSDAMAMPGFGINGYRDQLAERIEQIRALPVPNVPEGVDADLRPYQVEGFQFLANRQAVGIGSVLADDMGLGKTLQTLTWWKFVSGDAGERSSLVVCPKSVGPNWVREAKRFIPGVKIALWRDNPGNIVPGGITVMNYSEVRISAKFVTAVDWYAAIIDEAQNIKNPKAQIARAVCMLKAKHRLALTGTPIENRLLDLFSIVNFTTPGLLGSEKAFKKNYPEACPKARKRLASRIGPLLLRRTKAQVDIDLPERIEEDLIVDMDKPQRAIYHAEIVRARESLDAARSDINAARFCILTHLLRLRQICCHPVLADAANAHVESAKISAFIDTVEPIVSEGQKVLVFSQFVEMLNAVSKELAEAGVKTFTITGATENRQDVIDAFDAYQGGAVFLISLKAGGTGLNLTSANYVILADPWWNPAAEAQAIDRAHRIGQTQKVIAYRIIARNSVEERIRSLQAGKNALAADVLGESSFLGSLTVADFDYLFSE